MALKIEEIIEIKAELGYNVTGVGAEVYIGYSSVFDRAVQPYLIDYGTTSTTAVAAASGGASVSITLVANPAVTGSDTQTTAFVVGSTVLVDVGAAQESAIITRLSGLTATMVLANAHGVGTTSYPIVLYGAEGYIRDILTRIRAIRSALGGVAIKTAGVEQVDEVKLSASERGRTKTRNKFDDLIQQREIARMDLAAALGVPYSSPMRRRGGSGLIEIY